jgi:hypothetical protein
MIRLSDDEVAAILQAARPIPRDRRKAFLVAVADELQRLGALRGEGSSHRIVKLVARQFFDAPDLSGDDDAA